MIIGIDPDVSKSGVCILKQGEIIELKSMTFCEIMELVFQRPVFHAGCKFAIEDIESRKPTYQRNANKAAMLKIAQNVGMCKGAARLIIEFIEQYTGEKVIRVPVGLGKSFKKDAKLFNKLSGWPGQSNEDTRDAWAIAKYAENL